MELTDLEIFQCVATTGGVTQAAQHLNRVQSGVSARISRLEEELGALLFARQGRSMLLTANGRTLLHYTEAILRLAREARKSLSGDVPSGAFRLGSMESTSAAHLPRLLGTYHTRWPQVALELSTGATADLVRDVMAYRLDAAFVSEPAGGEDLAKAPAYQEELVLVAAQGQSPITGPEHLLGRTLLVFKQGCAYRKRLEQWAGPMGGLGRTVELASYQTMLGCAASGMGVGIMPRSVMEMLQGSFGVSLHSLPADIAQARTSLIWRTGNETAALRALVQLLQAPEMS